MMTRGPRSSSSIGSGMPASYSIARRSRQKSVALALPQKTCTPASIRVSDCRERF